MVLNDYAAVLPPLSLEDTTISSQSMISPIEKLKRMFTPDRHRRQERKPIHFDGSPESMFDGEELGVNSHNVNHFAQDSPHLLTRAVSSKKSRLSRSLSTYAESVTTKVNPSPEPPTIVRRPDQRPRPAIPHLNTNIDKNPKSFHEHESAVIAYSNSSTPSGYDNSGASPLSKFSTGQTSLFLSGNSIKSQKSVEMRFHPDQSQSPNRQFLSCAEELAPIEESGVRLFDIPCQEAPLTATPSIVTVESVTAAKIFFETHFDGLLSDSTSPRSMRRKKLQHRL